MVFLAERLAGVTSEASRAVLRFLGVERDRGIDDAVAITVRLLLNANNSVHIAGGNLGNDLWTDSRVIAALERVAGQQDIDVRIIYGPGKDNLWVRVRSEKSEDYPTSSARGYKIIKTF